jgi:hypothetical protein
MEMNMFSLKFLPVVLAFSVMPPAATAQQPLVLNEVVDKIAAREHTEMQLLQRYSPLVETYIQYIRADQHFGEVPDGDKYFLGRAVLAKGLELEPLNREAGMKQKMLGGWGDFFSMEFVPAGFLQMIYLDTNGFDRQHYKFEYVRREFLGEVRCMVFDIEPLPKAGKRRFVGRIWVEDHDYHIVRFNGSYGTASSGSYYFDFDSWRMNVGPNLWVPAYVYVQDGSVRNAKARNLGFKAFRAQTRLWGYHVGHVGAEQELSKILVDAPAPVTDQTETDGDLSPLQAERSWSRKAEDNVVDHLEQQGLLAPYGEVDKVLETVLNNLEVTNGLDMQPDVRCRVLMTSTLESFTMGHTIVLSRGLIDVLPDEASLGAILAHELGHIVLGHRMDTQFAFVNRLRFAEKETFRHFDFTRSPEEEQLAAEKGAALLKNSPYRDQSSSVQLFLQTLKDRSKEIPNLISPHLGDKVPTDWVVTPASSSAAPNNTKANDVFAALPVGGRIKVNPWNDQLRMAKYKPVGAVAEDEKRPLQITPLVPYLARPENGSPTESATGVPAESGPATP